MNRTCDQCGKHLVTQRADARFCSDSCRTRHKNEARKQSATDTRVNGASGAVVHPLADARAAQEATELKSHWSQVIYQGIVDRLKQGPVHADDLEPLFPANEEERVMCRKLVGAQFGSLASRKYIQSTGEYRKSKVPTRKCAKSWVYEFTQRGRDRLVGVGAGTSLGRAQVSEPVVHADAAPTEKADCPPAPSTHSGETPAGVSSEQSVYSSPADPSPSLAAHPGGTSLDGSPAASAPLAQQNAGESCPTLFEVKDEPRSAFTDPEIGEAA